MDEPTSLLTAVSTRPLRAVIADDSVSSLSQKLSLLAVAAEALTLWHARGRFHGSVSLDSILIVHYEEGPPSAKLTQLESTKNLAPSADNYALGEVVFEALVGRAPWPGETLEKAMPSAPAALDKLVSRLLASDPDDRPTVEGAWRQLQDLAHTLSETPSKPLSSPPQRKPSDPNQPADTRAKSAFTEMEMPRSLDSARDRHSTLVDEEVTAMSDLRRRTLEDGDAQADAADVRMVPWTEDEKTQNASLRGQTVPEMDLNAPEKGRVKTCSVSTASPTRVALPAFEPDRADLPDPSVPVQPPEPRRIRRKHGPRLSNGNASNAPKGPPLSSSTGPVTPWADERKRWLAMATVAFVLLMLMLFVLAR